MSRLVALLTVIAVLYAVPSTAGPDKIAFPAKYKDHVLYTTVDRHDTSTASSGALRTPWPP